MENNKDKKLLQSLKEFLTTLDIATQSLNGVYLHAKTKDLDNDDPGQLETFDALAIRFARAADIYTQKILRVVFLLLREDAPTFIDRVRVAEKLNLVTTEDDLIFLRDLRNSIVHEYAAGNVNEIFKTIIDSTPLLLENISKTRLFIREKFGE